MILVVLFVKADDEAFSFPGAHFLVIDLCLRERSNWKWWDEALKNQDIFQRSLYLFFWKGDGKFFTMLDAYWWALITMTTVRSHNMHSSLTLCLLFVKILYQIKKTEEKYINHARKQFWYENYNQFSATWHYSLAVQVNHNMLKSCTKLQKNGLQNNAIYAYAGTELKIWEYASETLWWWTFIFLPLADLSSGSFHNSTFRLVTVTLRQSLVWGR